MRFGLFVLAAIVASGSLAAGAALPPASIPSAVDSVFAQFDRSGWPGCALAVFRDGRIEYERAYGMANLELGHRLTPQTIFDIGSTSKQFTAMSILLLARDGKLSLADDVRKYLPELPDYNQRITIRHLLHHTSGVRDYLELMELEGYREEDYTTDEDALAAIARQKALNFAPGEEHLYSNSGYFLLSLIVRRVSGESLREFAAKRIFGPLGMIHTQINNDHTRIIAGRATGYAPDAAGGFKIEMSDYEQTGDGSVLTSVEDLLLWDRNFYNPRVGDAALLAEMQTPGKLNNGNSLSYALGLVPETWRGLKRVSHGGAWAGYRAELMRFPDQGLSVACLCNLSSTDPSDLAEKVAAIYLREKLTPEPEPEPAAATVALPPLEFQRFVGAYRNPKTGTIWKLHVEEGRLVVNTGVFTFALVPVGVGRFRSVDAPADLAVSFDQAVPPGRSTMTVAVNGKDTRKLEPIDLWTPTPAQLTQYAGTYVSDEIGTPFRITVESGGLVVRRRSARADPLEPALPDAFDLSGSHLTFSRDPKRRVTGFTLDSGRVRNLVFRKRS